MGNCCNGGDGRKPKMDHRGSSIQRNDSISSSTGSQTSHSRSLPPGIVKKMTPDFVAFWEYRAANKSELELHHGDRLVQLEPEGRSMPGGEAWMFVFNCSAAADEAVFGYVPRSYLVSVSEFETFAWNFGNITREQSEALLNRTPKGTFLIRTRMPTPDEKKSAYRLLTLESLRGYVLSVKYQKRECRHYKVVRMVSHGRPYFSITGDTKQYKTLLEMVTDLKGGVAAEILCCSLKDPCPRPKPPIATLLPLSLQDTWQKIPRHRIKMRTELGKPARDSSLFISSLAHARGPGKTVVVRQIKMEKAGGLEQFLSAAVALKNLGKRSNKFVQLLGVVSVEYPLLLVMEYCLHGSLRRYLRKRARVKKLLKEKALVDVCKQIADGMRVMEQIGLVHRALTAESVLTCEESMKDLLVGSDNERLTVKISGLHMSMSLKSNLDPVKASGGFRSLPVKWTAPEVLKNPLDATPASDVWSYGMTLHEIFTHGCEPYSGLTEASVRSDYISKNKGIERDPLVPAKVYNLMRRCCRYVPDARLSFSQIFLILDSYYLNPG